MPIGRRELLVLGAAGAAAAVAGAIAGAFALQFRGAADLLSAQYPDLDGQPRRLLDWKGKVVLCNFWATWCAPCRDEIPLLVDAKQQWGAKGAEVVGIGIDTADKIREFSRIYKVNYPVLIADASALALLRKLGNRGGGLPYSVLLDASGAIAHRHLGPLSAADIRRFLASLSR